MSTRACAASVCMDEPPGHAVGAMVSAVCRLTADGASWSRWHAEFALVYMMPVNGLLKRAIEKGMPPHSIRL